MKILSVIILIVIALTACANVKEFEKGEIEAVKMLKEILLSSKTNSILLDTRKIVTRKKIDDANVPVLFVELDNGQNGTLTLYPDKGVGETWLGADGATITLEKGVIKATRGMRGDVMGSMSSMPLWSGIKDNSEHTRHIYFLGGDNQTYKKSFSCTVKKYKNPSTITNFGVIFYVQEYVETCFGDAEKLENIYYVDNENVVRRSKQYHGPELGYLLIERLER